MIARQLNTNNFLKYYSLVSNVSKYIKDHLKENCVNVNFDILSKKDAYLERIVHSKNVRFVYKDLGIQFISSLFKSIKITRMWVNKIT
jgi:hypothetical protein